MPSGGREEEGGGGRSRESPSRHAASAGSAVTPVIEPPGVHVGPLVTLDTVSVMVSEVAAWCLTAQNAEPVVAPDKQAVFSPDDA